MRRAVVALVLVMMLTPVTARANFVQVGSAAAVPRDLVCDLQTAGGRLEVLTCDRSPGGVRWRVSGDGGVSWTDAAAPGMTHISALGQGGAAAVAYGELDGVAGFAVLGSAAVALRGPDSYVRALGGVPDGTGGHRMLVSAEHVVGSTGETIGQDELVTVDAGGKVTHSARVPVVRGLTALLTAVDGALWFRDDSGWASVAADGTVTDGVGGPVWIDLGNGTQLRADGLFIGGLTAEGKNSIAPVPGAPTLWATYRGLLRQAAPDLYVPYWQQPPFQMKVVSDGARLYAAAVGTADEEDLTVDPAAIWSAPYERDVPSAIGSVDANAMAMVAAANRLRADARLPPLIADGAISRAAANHSRYWTLNRMPQTLAVHNETPGKPGYTGTTPSGRCAAVGASCGGEIMAGGPPEDAPVWWLTSTFHRSLIGDADAVLVGAGRSGTGPDVMNGDSTSGLLLSPRGLPIGIWRGDLGFSGELPDPAERCAAAKQRTITSPYGTAVSVQVPTGGVATAVELRRVGDGRPLAGCTLGTSFTPDNALDAGTDYQATAHWTFAGVPQPDFTWRFHTEGRHVLARTGVRIASKARRAHGRWRVVVTGGRAVGRLASVAIRRYARRWSRLTGATVTRRVTLARSVAVVLPAHAKGWRVHVSVAPFANYAATSLTRRVR